MCIRDRDATVSPVPLSVAPSRDTDGGIVGLSEVTHPDDNRIEVADGSQKRRPSIRTSAGGSSYEGESPRSLRPPQVGTGAALRFTPRRAGSSAGGGLLAWSL